MQTQCRSPRAAPAPASGPNAVCTGIRYTSLQDGIEEKNAAAAHSIASGKKEDVRRSGILSVGTGCLLSADVAPARLPTRPPLLLAPTRGHAQSCRHHPPWPPPALHAVPPPPATLRMSQDLKPHLLGPLVLTGPIAAAKPGPAHGFRRPQGEPYTMGPLG